jgi:hypothetical protein
MTTRPTIDTILERLDEWGTRFKIEFSGIHEGRDSLRKSIPKRCITARANFARVSKEV